MDPAAENYDVTSDFDDGSCSYTVELPVAVYALPTVTSVSPTELRLDGKLHRLPTGAPVSWCLPVAMLRLSAWVSDCLTD